MFAQTPSIDLRIYVRVRTSLFRCVRDFFYVFLVHCLLIDVKSRGKSITDRLWDFVNEELSIVQLTYS
jgi:hypothetical protein